jgi:hypothetical protein
MKKLILMLVILAMAAPLYAAGRVQFYATDNEDGTCTITFDANDVMGIEPVAMGLDVKVNGSDPSHAITAVSGMDSFFDIFMDYAYDDPCSYTYGAGHPVADPNAAGSASLPSHHFCVSMGGLGGESGTLDPAPDNGVAFVLTAGNLTDPGSPVTGHIKISALRGGVIGKDTGPMETNLVPVHLPFTISTNGECYPSDAPGYATWLAMGSPDCWCYKYNCKGDTDNIGTGLNLNKKWVVLADLQLLGASLAKPVSDPTLPANYQCANFDRVGTGLNLNKKWVVLGDLQILGGGLAKPVSDPHFATPCPINDPPGYQVP